MAQLVTFTVVVVPRANHPRHVFQNRESGLFSTTAERFTPVAARTFPFSGPFTRKAGDESERMNLLAGQRCVFLFSFFSYSKK